MDTVRRLVLQEVCLWYDYGDTGWMEQALKPDVRMQIVRGFSVYVQVAKIKTALTWLHISLMNSSDYCIQASPCLACAFVLCSDLEPVFSRTRWNTVSSQTDTIVGLLAMLTIFSAIKTENRFMILWINSKFSNTLQCLCHCLSLVSHVKHEANIFGHSADCHHNSLCLGRCSWLRLRVSLFVAPYVNTLPGDLWAIIKSCLQDACEEWLQRLCISLRLAFTLLFSGLINCEERAVITLFHVVGILSQSKRLPFVCVFCCHLSHSWLRQI